MSTPTNYFNKSLDMVPKEGGAVRVTIASNVGQGNGGTSLPCKKVWVSAALSNAAYVHMNIQAAATSVLGITLPGGVGGVANTAVISTAVVPAPLMFEIDDVNKLYFHSGTNGDAVDILYRR